jgi:ribonuclease R
MVGERTHLSYRLGDRLKVKVVRVDMETSKIDLSLMNTNIGKSKKIKNRKDVNHFSKNKRLRKRK